MSTIKSKEPVAVVLPERTRPKPFKFFALPSELRIKVYELLLHVPSVLDLDPMNCRRIAPRLQLFLVCHQMHEEAYRVFYGGNAFRLYPTHGRFFHKKPLFSRLSPRYRAEIATVDLRLGIGWTKPGKHWLINPKLGLQDMKFVRALRIFIEIDPASSEIFEGFRKSKDYYTDFCRDQLKSIFAALPSLREVQFDAYPSVAQDCPLMHMLLSETAQEAKKISWGPERGWQNKQAES